MEHRDKGDQQHGNPFHSPSVGDRATRSLRIGYGRRLLDFRILGPLEVVDENGPLRLGGPKQRAVLALLLLDANRVVSIDRLANELYGDQPPATVLTQIQAHVSQLRRQLDPDRSAGSPGSLIETRPPGYVIRVAPEQLDLSRFERLTAEAEDAVSRGSIETAAQRYRDALDLWRGPALGDLVANSPAHPAAARLEDLRLAALEARIDADLSLGRHTRVAGELEALVAEHPLRERMHGQLMRALYGSGRQAEALGAYRRLRATLIDELGLEPGPALQELERAVLRQDPALDPGRARPETARPVRQVLVVASTDAGFDALLAVAEPLGAQPGCELILVRAVSSERELEAAAAATSARRHSLGVPARAAAFTSSERALDIVRLTTTHDVELVLVDADRRLKDPKLPRELAELLAHSPAHVAMVSGVTALRPDGAVFVPFGGSEHDWAALELASRLAASSGASLRLVGRRGDPREHGRDASRLLADASLAVQRLLDVDAEPLLCEPTEGALVHAVADASTVVTGISPRWQRDGIGTTRGALLRAGVPIVLVHRGPRPGGLAPRASRTRFTWSLRG